MDVEAAGGNDAPHPGLDLGTSSRRELLRSPTLPPVKAGPPRHTSTGATPTCIPTYRATPSAMGTRLRPTRPIVSPRARPFAPRAADEVRLRRPLDFLMVSDHAENLGVAAKVATGDPNCAANRRTAGAHVSRLLTARPALVRCPEGRRASRSTKPATCAGNAKTGEGGRLRHRRRLHRHVWMRSVVESAEKHNDPGRFTTFVGYEYSSGSPAMLHRNVMFAGVARNTPCRRRDPSPPATVKNPEDLWAYLESYRERTGSDVISIPHNSNLSRGNMFSDRHLRRRAAEQRIRQDPVVHRTHRRSDADQGRQRDSSRPFRPTTSSPTTRAGAISRQACKRPKLPKSSRQSYVRSALQTGLALGAELGVNPYKFGMIGSTDSHTGLATADEDNFWGKMGASRTQPLSRQDDPGAVRLLGLRRGLGNREHPRGHLRRHEAARGLRDDGAAHHAAVFRRLGLRRRRRV